VTSDVNLDLARPDRIGLAEAVLAEPKSVDQLVTILGQADDAGHSMLLTRLSPEQLNAMPDQLASRIDYDEQSRTGFFGDVSAADTSVTEEPEVDSKVAVVCAGTADRPVAAEVERTLAFSGVVALSVSDVGVAGLWRLTERLDDLRAMDVVIVVAGMDGALPTVVAGLISGVVIAVPTSVGYGVAAHGHAALNSSLASCAPGLVVVNIDNGYGAACAAIRVLGIPRS